MVMKRMVRPRPMADFVSAAGRTPRTIRRYVAEARADYEGRSISRARPWAALGVSRATWYRKRKETGHA